MKKQTEGKKMKKKKNKKRDCELKHTKTEWVLCSEDWRNIVIMYVPELNDIPIEDNYQIYLRKKLRRHTNNTREEHR